MEQGFYIQSQLTVDTSDLFLPLSHKREHRLEMLICVLGPRSVLETRRTKLLPLHLNNVIKRVCTLQ